MSDMLNENFEELVKEQNVILEAGDPMPTVTASVIPGEGSEPTAISDVQTSKAGGKDGMQSIQPSVAIGQSSPTDLGGTSTTPHEHDDDGEENPGAKAAAPISQISGDAQQAHQKDPGTPQYSIGSDVSYGTTTGPNVTYPINPAFEDLDVSADMNALMEGENLSKRFTEKAKTIFEAALKSKLTEEYTKLEEQAEKDLASRVEEAKNALAEEVKGMVTYGINRWLEENQLAVDRGVRNEITEDFIAGLKGLFAEHYINIPEDKADVVEEMADTIREMEERVNQEVARNVELSNRLNESDKKAVLAQVLEGLADTQKDKLTSLAEGIHFESVEKYTQQDKTLRESYFPQTVKASEVGDANPVPVVETSRKSMMDQYAAYINKN